jgi:transposase-like protein
MRSDDGPLGGAEMIVEADETFVGGRSKNRAFKSPAAKKKVLALVERGGRARSFHVANIHGNTIRAALVTNVDRASVLMTDEAHHYKAVGREFTNHGHILHAGRQYASGIIHSNSAEGFFSILKRGVVGTYHHWSEAHIHRYLAEFDFRYSTRKISDTERTAEALKGARGKRLMYRQPSSLAA